MNFAAPALAGRRCVGPACPRIPPGTVDGDPRRFDEHVVDDLAVDHDVGKIADDDFRPAVRRRLERVFLRGREPAEEHHR
jgi:hypothetical protein